ncbi:MAG: MarR family transcriptional regulator [Eubacteriales bacterium]|nr:MarR family transcriptional regulator [Eubacteriales bacterium]
MNTTSLKSLLDACFLAKRVAETMPELPPGMKPRHIHVMEAIHELEVSEQECRVSDVSARLGVTTPSITKLIHELEGFGMVDRFADKADKRVNLLRLTPKGMESVRIYIYELHAKWVEGLKDITDQQAQEAVMVIERLAGAMPAGKKKVAKEEL